MRKVYLDHAAATPVDKRVLVAMQPYWADQFYNPSALYVDALKTKQALQAARRDVAVCLGAKQSEIIFTSGGTEANNLAIHGVLFQFPGCHIVTSAVEHESVLQTIKPYKHSIVSVDKHGRISLEDLAHKISDSTVLISVMYANNELGTIQPIREITRLAKNVLKKRRESGNNTPLYVHTDAAQAAALLDIHVSRLGVDMLSLNSGKIYGPKGNGALFVKVGVKLAPQLLGGGQERGLRSGTENVAGIVGLAAALKQVRSNVKPEAKRLAQLQDYFIRELTSKLKNAFINSPVKGSLPSTVNVTFKGSDNERLMMQLDEHGIMCATGSACSASADEPSHVLAAIGMKEVDIRSTLRFSMGKTTTKDDVDHTIKTLVSLLK